MANRAYFLIIAIVCCRLMASGQNMDYKQVDSTSYAQYQAGQWKTLADYGNRAVASGVDFPYLRLRIAYAQLSLGNYSAALTQYQQVLKNDSHDQTARYFSYLCNKYLGRTVEASYHASFVDTATLNLEHITKYGALEAGLETSVKIADNNNRGTGNYTRAWLNNRLGYRLQLDQSVAHFSQSITSNITVPIAGPPGSALGTTSLSYTDSQFEYYGKLSYSLKHNLIVLGAFHYLNTRYGQTSYQNTIGLLGLKYSHPYFSLQADAITAHIISDNFQQFNGQLTLYPLGNLNLYTISRVSQQSGNFTQTIFSQILGFKVAKPLWVQLSGTFGTMDNYIDADALYVYNAIDITKLRTGATAFYALGTHAIVYLNYNYEQKQDFYLNNNYNQHSVTGGFSWKF